MNNESYTVIFIKKKVEFTSETKKNYNARSMKVFGFT